MTAAWHHICNVNVGHHIKEERGRTSSHRQMHRHGAMAISYERDLLKDLIIALLKRLETNCWRRICQAHCSPTYNRRAMGYSLLLDSLSPLMMHKSKIGQQQTSPYAQQIGRETWISTIDEVDVKMRFHSWITAYSLVHQKCTTFLTLLRKITRKSSTAATTTL